MCTKKIFSAAAGDVTQRKNQLLNYIPLLYLILKIILFLQTHTLWVHFRFKEEV